MTQRPPIPDPMKREVRQRCGFGCVICGLPVYAYDHIEDWAQCQKHEAENITLLCDLHHREKTNGLLTREMVAAANAEPINRKNGLTSPYGFHFAGNTCVMSVGSNTLTGWRASPSVSYTGIRIDGLSVLEFTFEDEGNLYLSLRLFGKDNQPVLTVDNNEIVFSINAWDIAFIGTQLTVRHAPRNILFNMNLVPPNKVVIERGLFLYNDKAVAVTKNEIEYLNRNNAISGCEANLCGSLVEVGYPKHGGFAHLGD